MEAVKRAIRGALEKGDAQDRAFRERVYRQAFAALERSLKARPELSAEEIRQRRDRVKAIIVEIENEFLPAIAPSAPPSPPPPPTEPEPDTDFVPRVEREDRLSAREEPTDDIALPDGPRAPVAEPEGRRRPFAMLFLIATVVAALGIGAWWTLQSGIMQSSQQRDTSVPNPPLTEGEDFVPDDDTSARPAPSSIEAAGEWIILFSPDDPTTVRAAGGMSAEVMNDGEEAFMRIGNGAPDSAVSFDFGQGVLERLAGRRVIFSLMARAQEETQISLVCDFGALGDCGRVRYVVGSSPNEYLFETELPDGRPDSGGTIAIVPDIEGEGRLLDVFSLRVTTAD